MHSSALGKPIPMNSSRLGIAASHFHWNPQRPYVVVLKSVSRNIDFHSNELAFATGAFEQAAASLIQPGPDTGGTTL